MITDEVTSLRLSERVSAFEAKVVRWSIDSSTLQVRRRSPFINEVTIRRAISLVPIPRSAAISRRSAYRHPKSRSLTEFGTLFPASRLTTDFMFQNGCGPNEPGRRHRPRGLLPESCFQGSILRRVCDSPRPIARTTRRSRWSKAITTRHTPNGMRRSRALFVLVCPNDLATAFTLSACLALSLLLSHVAMRFPFASIVAPPRRTLASAPGGRASRARTT